MHPPQLPMLLALAINTCVVALVVGLHYEILHRLSNLLPHLKIHRRLRILVGVFGAIAGHVVEIWVFALAYWLEWRVAGLGYLDGEFRNEFLDCVYFSMVSYSTLGYGDIYPHGLLRFLAGIESLVGLVLITWTASFLFLEMQKYWSERYE